MDRLLAAGPIDLVLLARACDLASRHDRPLEQVMCDLGCIDDAALADAYASVTGLRRWSPEEQPPILPGPGLQQLGRLLDDRAMALLQHDDWAVEVATSDPMDDVAFAEVSRLSERMVTMVVAARSSLSPAPFGDESADRLPSRRPIIPWARKPDMEGAAMLQAVLNRRGAFPARDA